MKRHEWPQFIHNIFRILKPGVGWAQIIDYGGRAYEKGFVPTDSVDVKVCSPLLCSLSCAQEQKQFQEYVTKMMEKRNTPLPKVDDMRRYFADVVEKLIDIGGWSGGSGHLHSSLN